MSRFSLQDKNKSRSGRWTQQEEVYAIAMMEAFKDGLLEDIAEGESLRSYLSCKLFCNCKRVSKKYEGTNYNGAQRFLKKLAASPTDLSLAREKLAMLEGQFLESIRSVQSHSRQRVSSIPPLAVSETHPSPSDASCTSSTVGRAITGGGDGRLARLTSILRESTTTAIREPSIGTTGLPSAQRPPTPEMSPLLHELVGNIFRHQDHRLLQGNGRGEQGGGGSFSASQPSTGDTASSLVAHLIQGASVGGLAATALQVPGGNSSGTGARSFPSLASGNNSTFPGTPTNGPVATAGFLLERLYLAQLLGTTPNLSSTIAPVFASHAANDRARNLLLTNALASQACAELKRALETQASATNPQGQAQLTVNEERLLRAATSKRARLT